MLQEIKASCVEKKCQGDVNIYKLASDPKLETTPYKDPVLVYGNGGHHHKIVGKNYEVGKTKEGQFVLKVDKIVELSHEEHNPPHKLDAGVYLIDRAVEKGMFSDMVAPVVD